MGPGPTCQPLPLFSLFFFFGCGTGELGRSTAGSAADQRRRSGGCPWPPRAREEPLHHAAREEGDHGHGEARGRRIGARPASSPLDGDDVVATVHQTRNGLVREVEGSKWNISAGLIEEWIILRLAMAVGPPAVTSDDSEHCSAIPQPNEQGRSRGEEEEGTPRERAREAAFIDQRGRGR